MLESKTQLRAKIKQIFRQKSSDELKSLSVKVLEKLENSPEFQASQNIALFYSLPDEVYTHEFIDKWASAKNIFLPIIKGDDIFFAPYSGELVEGEYSISEPRFTRDYSSELDLVVVPGLSFSCFGDRLGRGRGFYDRFFARVMPRYIIGMCFDFQIVDFVPTQEHDRRVDRVVY
ncbi:MAG: 5-formyltetrahydrofolate cyclo-ligase [Rikenellaceae bacterium]